MSRNDEILKYIDRTSTGLEIAPYFSPVAPKRDGFNISILDVFDTETLRLRAQNDPFIPNERVSEIEPVDFVGSATEIHALLEGAGKLGQFDYVISSHNFEHLPNPIKFLQGAYSALKPGGVLSMAVPDMRACFDHFRYPTKLSDWLESYFENRERPTPKQVFDGLCVRAFYHAGGTGKAEVGCNLSADLPGNFKPEELLDDAYERWKSECLAPAPDYDDTHCSAFFNHSLELMLRDLQHLGLVQFTILEISDTHGLEFYVHLRKDERAAQQADDFYQKRYELLCKINQSLGWFGFEAWRRQFRWRGRVSIKSFDVMPRRLKHRTRKTIKRRIEREIARVGRQIRAAFGIG